MTALRGKTVFITGGSRGIGRAIALKIAADGANIVIASKTNEPHPKLPGTINTVAREIEAAGARRDVENDQHSIWLEEHYAPMESLSSCWCLLCSG